MNTKFLLPFCVLLMAMSYLQSCEEPKRSTDTSLLSGNWVIVNAKRNAKTTSTLNEAYFVFNTDSTMQTNFTGEEINGAYKIDGDVISQDSKDNFKYNIVDLSKDTLILSTQIMDYNFELFLLNERLDPFNKNEDAMEMIEGQTNQIDIDS